MSDNKTMNEGPHYFIDVYYDILDDDYCLWTIYRFTTKEIAEQFVEKVPFICADIWHTNKGRTDDGHTERCPYRPIFDNLEDALADAKEFEKYGNDKEYKYAGRVFQEDLAVIEKQYDKNTIKDLKKKVEELTSEVSLLKSKLESLKE